MLHARRPRYTRDARRRDRRAARFRSSGTGRSSVAPTWPASGCGGSRSWPSTPLSGPLTGTWCSVWASCHRDSHQPASRVDRRADPRRCCAYAAAGDPERTATLAFQHASLSHTANGVYGAMWAAALIAASFAEPTMAVRWTRPWGSSPAQSHARGGAASDGTRNAIASRARQAVWLWRLTNARWIWLGLRGCG